MNKLFSSLYIITLLTIFSSCRKDTPPLPDNLIQFETEKTGFEAIQNEVDIKLNLSRVAEANTSVTIELISNGITYGNEFTTDPTTTNNLLTVIIPAGSSTISFKVKKKAGVLLQGDESLKFAIKTITQPALIGKKSNLELSFSPIISMGTDLTLDGGTGGAAAVNSVFVDLSASTSKSVTRASWDLGFYNGADFRVIINNTNGASAIKIDKTDLKQVTTADVNPASLAIGNGKGTLDLIDDADGDLSKTVIKEIIANEADNKVYVISRIGGTGSTPSVNDLMKIRILRNANGYTLQYAKLDDANFTTITINKNSAYNFIAFSFDQGVADVEPTKERWDFEWTSSMYSTSNGVTVIPYAFSDLVFTNYLAGTQIAEVLTNAVTYDNFNENNIAQVTFSTERAAIGSKWRATSGPNGALPGVKTDRFYVIKDAAGNVYKLKFTSFIAQDGGERGKPKLTYALVKKGS